MGVRRVGRGGSWPSFKSLGENVCFSIQGKIKITIIKEEYRNEKNKSKKRF